jgi:hypothetical protein
MNSPSRLAHRLSWVAVAALTLLAACGGGSEAPTAVPQAVSEMGRRMHALSASSNSPADELRKNMEMVSLNATSTVSAKDLFDWAQYKFPDLFRTVSIPDTQFVYEGVTYTIRGFSNGNYLGLTTDGKVFGLGPFTNFQLLGFGNAADYAAQVQADRCLVNPASCNPNNPPPAGPLNGCTLPASTALATGTRLVVEWAYSSTSPEGSGTGESKIESLVDGPATFEGLSVIRTTSKTTNVVTIGGLTVNSTSEGKEYVQPADGGLLRFIGSETEGATAGVPGGFTTRTKVVATPPFVSTEFTLAVGQSVTLTETSLTTITQVAGGFSLPPITSTTSSTERHTYEARESITVRGRTFDTCRYKSFDPAQPANTVTQWYIYGLGLPAKSISVDGTTTTTLEFKSGSLNGNPI